MCGRLSIGVLDACEHGRRARRPLARWDRAPAVRTTPFGRRREAQSVERGLDEDSPPPTAAEDSVGRDSAALDEPAKVARAVADDRGELRHATARGDVDAAARPGVSTARTARRTSAAPSASPRSHAPSASLRSSREWLTTVPGAGQRPQARRFQAHRVALDLDDERHSAGLVVLGRDRRFASRRCASLGAQNAVRNAPAASVRVCRRRASGHRQRVRIARSSLQPRRGRARGRFPRLAQGRAGRGCAEAARSRVPRSR